MGHSIGLVACLHQLNLLVVFGSVEFGILHHLLDFILAQARVGLDGDLVLLARALVLGAHVQDTVGVNVKGDFDLGHATRRRRNAFEVELAQQLVACSDFALALEHLDRHGGLVVLGRGEGLRELRRDRGVLLDHLGHDVTHGLDAQRKRGNVQQQHVLAITREHLALDGCAHGHGFVGVYVLARLLAEKFLDLVLHLGHAGLTAHQNHVGNFADADASILDGGLARLNAALDQILDQGFELGARELDVEVLGPGGVGRDVGQVDVGLRGIGQLDLGLFRRFFQALQRQHIGLQVNTLFLLKLGDHIVDDALVEVFATQEGVAIGGQHLKLLFAIDVGNFDDRHVKRTTAQVINGNLAVTLFLLVQTKGQGSGCRLVDDALDFQPRNASGVLGGLALAVVEVGRNGDHRFGDRLAEIVFGGFFHLAQGLGADLGRRQLLATHFHPGVAIVGLADGEGHQVDVLLHFLLIKLAPNQALDGVERILGVGHGLALGGSAHQHFTIFLVSDDGRRGACTFAVFDDFCGMALHHSHT